MTDIQSRLLAALEALERTIVHDAECFIKRPCGDDGCPHGEAQHSCDCDYDVRRRLAIAQRIQAACEEALAEGWGGAVAEEMWRDGNVVAAFASPGREREDT